MFSPNLSSIAGSGISEPLSHPLHHLPCLSVAIQGSSTFSIGLQKVTSPANLAQHPRFSGRNPCTFTLEFAPEPPTFHLAAAHIPTKRGISGVYQTQPTTYHVCYSGTIPTILQWGSASYLSRLCSLINCSGTFNLRRLSATLHNLKHQSAPIQLLREYAEHFCIWSEAFRAFVRLTPSLNTSVSSQSGIWEYAEHLQKGYSKPFQLRQPSWGEASRRFCQTHSTTYHVCQ